MVSGPQLHAFFPHMQALKAPVPAYEPYIGPWSHACRRQFREPKHAPRRMQSEPSRPERFIGYQAVALYSGITRHGAARAHQIVSDMPHTVSAALIACVVRLTIQQPESHLRNEVQMIILLSDHMLRARCRDSARKSSDIHVAALASPC